MEAYGQTTPPKVNLEAVSKANGVPIGFIVAKGDIAVTVKSQRELKKVAGDNLISYQEIDGGHTVFFKAKDMSWFKEEVMGKIHKYNPI